MPMRAQPEPPSFYNDLNASLAEAWRLIARGVKDRRSPFHTPSIATISTDGAPAVRTIVLRGADPARRTLRFHSDGRSRKITELIRDPRVSVHFYDPGRKIQLRATGTAMIHDGDDTATAAWAATRPFSRECYRVTPGPGAEIATPADALFSSAGPDGETGRDVFRAVSVAIDGLEWLYLAHQGHRRAIFRWASDTLDARWLVP